MKKLEKYNIAPQAKFVKFKVRHFAEIPTISHDKAVPPMLDCLKSSPHVNVSLPWLFKFSSCPPCLAPTLGSVAHSPTDPRVGGHYDYDQDCLKNFLLYTFYALISSFGC